jgi:5-methylcytosine-specific restriction enzyme B
MADDHVRRDLLLKTALEILRDTGTKMPRPQVMEEIRRRLELTPYELTAHKSGLARHDTALGFMIGDA